MLISKVILDKVINDKKYHYYWNRNNSWRAGYATTTIGCASGTVQSHQTANSTWNLMGGLVFNMVKKKVTRFGTFFISIFVNK
jgi:hypothetical protein